MELAGVAIGVVGLAAPLAQASLQCYQIFEDMREVGNVQDFTLHELLTEGARLRRWEEGWGLAQGHEPPIARIDPTDYRYRHAVATLARIVAVFASVEILQSKYGMRFEVKSEGNSNAGGGGSGGIMGGSQSSQNRRRDRLRVHRPFSWLRSSSPQPTIPTVNPQPTIPTVNPQPTIPTLNPQPTIPTINPSNLQRLEHPRVLQDHKILPGLDEEITTMTKAIAEVQQTLSVYRKLRWVISDQGEFQELLRKLKSLNDGLYNVLPVPTSPSSGTSKLTLRFDIPFRMSNLRKNPDFVERKDLLDSIRQKVTTDRDTGNIIVLYGTGGMGKTQLILEYVYRHQSEYTSVFWVNVASKQTTHLGFTEIMKQIIAYHAQISGHNPNYAHIGHLLAVPGKLDSVGRFKVENEADILQIIEAVKQWFATQGNTKWLLILDNLDDLESFRIQDYIPVCDQGTIIITSRRRESTQGRRAVEIQEMKEDEAKSLLLRSAQRTELEVSADLDNELQVCVQLVAKLGCLPLALDQAGSHIHTRQYSFHRYLKEYERKSSYFLKQGWKVEDRNRSVFSTWELSFEAIEKQNPKAAELLLVCGYFNNEDICEELLRKGMELDDDDTTLDESIQSLFSYSMAKRKYKDDSFTIHPLVHEWARKRLEMGSETQRKVATEALEIVTNALYIGKRGRVVDDWIFERRIMPHVIEVTKQNIQSHPESQNDSANSFVLYTLGKFYREQGKYDEAKELYQRALVEYEKSLGPNHLDTLNTVYSLASVFENQGKYDKAVELYQRALAGYEKSLGSDHSDTLNIVNNLALVFNNQGKYDEAIELYQHALAGKEKSLGPDHSSTLLTVNNLASVFDNQGKHDEAKELYQRALAGKEKSLGPDHPSTLATVNNLALVFDNQGKYNEAKELYQRALAGYEKLLGPGHPSTLSIVNNLALVFREQGKYDEAKELYQRALAGQEKSLGPDHPDTLSTVNNLASVFDNQGKYDEAIELYQRALAGKEKSLGPDHPSTLSTVNNLALVFDNQGIYDEAKELYQRALAGREKSLGPDHPDTLSTVNNLALVFDNQGKYDEAKELYQRALVGKEKSLGPGHPSTLLTVNNLALVFDNQGKYNEAKELYQRALAGREKSLGPDHPSTLNTVNNLALVFDNQGKYSEAKELYQRALAGKEKSLGPDHPSTLLTVNNLAMVFDNQGKYDEAKELHQRALAGREKLLGPDHPDTLLTVYNMAILSESQGKTDEALDGLKRALEGQSRRLGDAHPRTQATLGWLIHIYTKIGETEQAEMLKPRLLSS